MHDPNLWGLLATRCGSVGDVEVYPRLPSIADEDFDCRDDCLTALPPFFWRCALIGFVQSSGLEVDFIGVIRGRAPLLARKLGGLDFGR